MPMSVSEIVGGEIDRQAALSAAALCSVSADAAGVGAKQLRPRAVFDMLAPYSAALYVAERVVESTAFNPELI